MVRMDSEKRAFYTSAAEQKAGAFAALLSGVFCIVEGIRTSTSGIGYNSLRECLSTFCSCYIFWLFFVCITWSASSFTPVW